MVEEGNSNNISSYFSEKHAATYRESVKSYYSGKEDELEENVQAQKEASELILQELMESRGSVEAVGFSISGVEGNALYAKKKVKGGVVSLKISVPTDDIYTFSLPTGEELLEAQSEMSIQFRPETDGLDGMQERVIWSEMNERYFGDGVNIREISGPITNELQRFAEMIEREGRSVVESTKEAHDGIERVLGIETNNIQSLSEKDARTALVELRKLRKLFGDFYSGNVHTDRYPRLIDLYINQLEDIAGDEDDY